MDAFNEQAKVMFADSKKSQEQFDQGALDNLRRKIISSFKMVFKLKVLDARNPSHTATITFFDQDDETHQSLRPGDRLRLLNLTPTNSQMPELQLNFVKSSKIIHVTDSVLKPKKLNEMINSYKALAEKQTLTLAEFKRKYNEIDAQFDISFYAYVLKVVASKDQEVLKVLAMS
jgi:hypothetical protein